MPKDALKTFEKHLLYSNLFIDFRRGKVTLVT